MTDDITEPRAHVREFDAIQQASMDAILAAERRKRRDEALARAHALRGEWNRLMTLDNTPMEFIYPDSDTAEDFPDYSAALAEVEQKLNDHMREHYDDLIDQPIWREWYGPADEPARPRTTPTAAPILNNDPPF